MWCLRVCIQILFHRKTLQFCEIYKVIWRFPKMGVPQNHPSKWMILGVPAAGTRWQRDWAPDTTATQMQERTALFSTNGHSSQSAAHVTRLSVSMKRKEPVPSHILQSSDRIRAACRRGKPDKDVDLLHQHRKKDQVCRP